VVGYWDVEIEGEKSGVCVLTFSTTKPAAGEAYAARSRDRFGVPLLLTRNAAPTAKAPWQDEEELGSACKRCDCASNPVCPAREVDAICTGSYNVGFGPTLIAILPRLRCTFVARGKSIPEKLPKIFLPKFGVAYISVL
jgi:hypothetical protein